MASKQITIRIKKSLINVIDQLAKKENKTRAGLVKELIVLGLINYKLDNILKKIGKLEEVNDN
jgi:predicted DNA-binding protein